MSLPGKPLGRECESGGYQSIRTSSVYARSYVVELVYPLRAASPSARHASTSAPPIRFSFHVRSSFFGNLHASLAPSTLPSCTNVRIRAGVCSTSATSSLVLRFLASSSSLLSLSSGLGADFRSVSLIDEACEYIWAMAGSKVEAIGFRGSMLARIYRNKPVSLTKGDKPRRPDRSCSAPSVLSRSP